jgi:hypothetical protein
MAKPPSTAAANYEEPDFKHYVEKPATATQEHFHDWVLDKTGYDPATAKTKAAAFEAGIRIGTSLRGLHQASPENQERLAEQRAASADAKAAKEAEAANAAAAPAKAAPAKATKATKAAAPVVPPVETAPPVKRAPAKKTGGRRAAATDAPAPF